MKSMKVKSEHLIHMPNNLAWMKQFAPLSEDQAHELQRKAKANPEKFIGKIAIVAEADLDNSQLYYHFTQVVSVTNFHDIAFSRVSGEKLASGECELKLGVNIKGTFINTTITYGYYNLVEDDMLKALNNPDGYIMDSEEELFFLYNLTTQIELILLKKERKNESSQRSLANYTTS